MRIGIDMGHTLEGPNSGAVGIIKESEETRRLGKKVIKYLEDLGHNVVNCTVDDAISSNDSLNKRVSKANEEHLDIFVSIHFNQSSGGYGSEIYTANAKELPQAVKILKDLNALGFTSSTRSELSRGIKDGSGLYVIRNTKSISMLVEVCFVDNPRDVALYKANLDKIAKIVADGIVVGSINKGEKDEMTQDTVRLSACSQNPISLSMVEEIKILQNIVKLNQDGIAREELINKLPELKGGESRGVVTVMQRILIMKKFLSKGSDTGVIGPANKNAINRFKSEVGIPSSNVLVDKLTWRKLLEY
ncbi:N-acetylmuramoyl-L-alanine amidase [Clostridium cylindrosporum]|nr:N-acetylmuramoyl-L-alanine amidase [Clostridium cylindrosporum]